MNQSWPDMTPNEMLLNGFPIFDFERTWWRLFYKRVVCTKFDIYIFILIGQYI
jgi:hypothetical protein